VKDEAHSNLVTKEVFHMHRKECFRRHDTSELAIKELNVSIDEKMTSIRKMVTGIIVAFSVTTLAAFFTAFLLRRG